METMTTTTKATIFDHIAEFWRVTIFTARMRRVNKERYAREQERRARDTRFRRITTHIIVE